ncbi:hypothetical protein EON77_09720 [bacterium]|nr:MAG: hypothetical protein EON77_09720 [bacterium]
MKPFWISLIAAALAAKPILAGLRAMKSRQTVSQYAPANHQVKQGTPTMGGLIVLVGMLAGLILAFPGENRVSGAFGWSALLLILGFTAIGFVDDFVVPRLIKGKRGLGWRQKIVAQIVAAFIGVLPLGLGMSGNVWAVFLILFCANAYNFADGLDGLAAGIGLAYCGGLLALGTGFHPIALTVAGGLIVFLFLNAHPAKIFMGDVGSLPIGAVFGLAGVMMTSAITGLDGAISISFTPSMFLALVALNLMLIAELVPVPMQVFSMKTRKKRIFPATPIHHGFEVKGWPETRVVAAFTLVQILASALAYTILR